VLIRSYRDLLVWQKAVDLVTGCYTLTKVFPEAKYTDSHRKRSEPPSRLLRT